MESRSLQYMFKQAPPWTRWTDEWGKVDEVRQKADAGCRRSEWSGKAAALRSGVPCVPIAVNGRSSGGSTGASTYWAPTFGPDGPSVAKKTS